MLTIKTWLNTLGRSAPTECPIWPPDLYAISGALLKRSGAYLRIFEHRKSRTPIDDVYALAMSWRKSIDRRRRTDRASLQRARPRAITDLWMQIVGASETRISDLRRSTELADGLLRMALISDEASAGIGIDSVSPPANDGKPSVFLSLADWILTENENRSFCLEVSPEILCVLGKQHTPQRGATFRSLTHHLALFFPGEIEPRWIVPLNLAANAHAHQRMLNLLLLPWPTQVDSGDFSEVQGPGNTPTGYFRFSPKQSLTLRRFERVLTDSIENAHTHAGAIHGIIFPELALSHAQYEVAERIAVERGAVLIAGIRSPATRRSDRDMNLSILQPTGALLRNRRERSIDKKFLENMRLTQAKHHRWCLDRAQLVSYQLSGQLPVSDAHNCWENIELPSRRVNFVTFNQMTWTVLVCEDLARQDPAADLIRAVGPNLLIALLMDGPQMAGRWSSRYASVLAEDPGTSVLTLTNLGMAQRCRPMLPTGRRAEPSRVVALWRDALSGETEIALDPNDNACVLSLECRLREELAADGRSDGSQSRYPIFAGFKSFRTEA